MTRKPAHDWRASAKGWPGFRNHKLSLGDPTISGRAAVGMHGKIASTVLLITPFNQFIHVLHAPKKTSNIFTIY
jgi:hypothetical protein